MWNAVPIPTLYPCTHPHSQIVNSIAVVEVIMEDSATVVKFAHEKFDYPQSEVIGS
jgi:hypothetical protein